MSLEILNSKGLSFIVDKNNTVHNNTTQNSTVTFFEYKEGYIHYKTNILQPGWWCISPHKKVDRILITNSQNEYYIIENNIKGLKDPKLLDCYQSFDFESPIFLITGHAGGGTSIIVKFLRYLKVHFGDDCGKITTRKPHESVSIRSWWDRLEEGHSIKEYQDSFKKILGHYNYKPQHLNMLKFISHEANRRVAIMGDIFPNLKVVSIVKPPSSKPGLTTESNDLSSKDPKDVLLTQLPIVEGTSIFHLEWNRFFMDYQYCNKLLKFLKVNKHFKTTTEFNSFLEMIGFDNSYLN
tara:strand:- start:221 stop:1105 length:885 start_codon:yes stop_codon:yes gene_type:complete